MILYDVNRYYDFVHDFDGYNDSKYDFNEVKIEYISHFESNHLSLLSENFHTHSAILNITHKRGHVIISVHSSM